MGEASVGRWGGLRREGGEARVIGKIIASSMPTQLLFGVYLIGLISPLIITSRYI